MQANKQEKCEDDSAVRFSHVVGSLFISVYDFYLSSSVPRLAVLLQPCPVNSSSSVPHS